MRIRTRQLLFTVVLLAPVGFAVVTAPPFVGSAGAQMPGGGMLGPNAPARAGSTPFYPTLVSGSTYRMNSPWDCDTGDNEDEVSFGGGPPYTSARRNNEGTSQALFITGSSGGMAMMFGYDDDSNGDGDAELMDGNGDGAYETLMGDGQTGGGSPVMFTMSLQFMDNDMDGNPDHVSVPWGQVGALGWLQYGDGCNDTEPQVWAPLADTDGDGRPDAIVLDLDGDSSADSQFHRSPRLVAAAVPTINWQGTTLLALMLAGLAMWSLSRRGRSEAV